MKKTISLIVTLLLAIGLASAQTVYFAGQANDTAKVWVNETLSFSISDTLPVRLNALQIAPDSSVATAGFRHDATFDYVQGRVWLNDNPIFAADSNTTINRLILNGNNWIAAGVGENEWENMTGLVWQDGEPLYAFSDSLNSHQINALAIDTTTGDIYTGGSITDSLSFHASVWINDTLLWQETIISGIVDMAHDGTDLYAIGYFILEGLSYPTLWQNDSIIFNINAMENDGAFEALALYGGHVYIAGYQNDSLVVWQDSIPLYGHVFADDADITALAVNESGVYYAGQLDGVATVWKDGEVLFQPEGCDAVTALCVLPPPPQQYFTLTVEVNDTLLGTVTGGGEYALGDTATIAAFPNIGCEFLYWNDGIADNPRTVIVLGDSTFTAYFGLAEYLIETAVSPEGTGTVTGGGTYHYGDTIELVATANTSFEFTGWSDGITDNPRSVVVTESHLYTALFGIQQCQIHTEVTPEGAGTVEGGGTYGYGSTIHLIAHNNIGFAFSQWADGIIENPRTVVVQGDATYTAMFAPLQYEITTLCDPEEGGSVSGGGTYHYGDTASLVATANPNYQFLCWNDGFVSNPRTVIVTKNATYTALFYQNGTPQYTITVTANDTLLGTVTGGGIYPEGTTIEIGARAKENAVFRHWDDGNTDNPRSLTVTQDMSFTAIFESIPFYTIDVLSDDILLGMAYGGGVYQANEVIEIGAIPNEGCCFTGWQDGDQSNPRTVTVTGNAVYTAHFSVKPVSSYTITVYYDQNQGFVIGAGTYAEGSTATLAAIPADDYKFVKWSDENTDNPRDIVVTEDLVLAVFFNTTDVGENNGTPVRLYPNPANDIIHIEGLDGQTEACLYNMLGMQVKSLSLNDGDDIDISDLPSGLYVLRADKFRIQFVKQ